MVSSESLPAIASTRAARDSPELAVLSALVHGKGDVDRAVAIARAALEASTSLDDSRSRLYADLVYFGLGQAARAVMEATMIPQNYEYQSDFARKYYGQGKAEGKVDALFVILAARGLEPSPEERARIAAERDGARLDRWLARAANASDVAELFEGDAG